MEVQEDLASLLDHYMKRESVGDARLATRVNSIADNAFFIHRSTIRNWRNGSSRKTNNWRQLVTVSAALNLNEAETNKLLEIGGCPRLSALSASARDSDHRLFKHWVNEPALDIGADTEVENDLATTTTALPVFDTSQARNEALPSQAPTAPTSRSRSATIKVGIAGVALIVLLTLYSAYQSQPGNMLRNSGQ